MKFDLLLNNKKHEFKIITKEKIKEGKEKLERNIPGELMYFFENIGCGFLNVNNKILFNRIISPLEMVDFYNKEEEYEFDDDRVDDYIVLEDELVFMEISELSFLTLDISKENKKGECPVMYEGEKIAGSLLEFLINMEEKDNYFLYY